MTYYKVPTTVFTGFLGSGKTTIISHLIDELQASNQQVIYIKNEIGNENVDAALLEGKHIQTRELLNGCICCTLVGPFISAIDEIIEKFNPARIIIEASGAADPAALALMIDSHPRLIRDGVLAIIDVVNFEGYKDLSITAQNQTKFTDLIVFNKIEEVDLQRKQAVVGYVRELNNYSPIAEAPHGVLSSKVAFGISTTSLRELLVEGGFTKGAVETHSHPHEHHLEQDGIQSFSLAAPSCNESQLTEFLGKLPGSVYRVKGTVKKIDGSWLLINKVGQRTTIEPLPSNVQIPDKSVIVLIGFRILDQKESTTQLLASLTK